MKEIEGLISIARKAGFVIIGQDNLKNYNKKLYLILLDESAGKALQREMSFKAKNITLLQVKELRKLVGIDNCKVIGIKNKAMAEKIASKIKGE